jgi:two-component system sensor histidine kinase ChiS
VSLIISEETMSRIQSPERYNFRCVDNVQIRRKLEPVKVFEIFDGDEASLINRKLSTRDDFEAGLNLYYNKKFPEASVKFNNVIQINPKDKTAKIYLERSARYMVNGVPTEWDGVEMITER